MADFYHLYFKAPGVEPTSQELVAQLDSALDWFRYSPTCWVLYTTSNADKWYARLGALAKRESGNVFICKLDVSESQGWMDKSLWEWIEKTQRG